jgi:hypothetical protein
MTNLATSLLAAASYDPWGEAFFGLDPDQRFIVVLTALGCLTGVVITLAGIAYSWIDGAHKRRIDAELKREMLDRGMSAEEVVKVIEAAPPKSAAERWAANWCKHKK